jgi:hypothetical protein
LPPIEHVFASVQELPAAPPPAQQMFGAMQFPAMPHAIDPTPELPPLLLLPLPPLLLLLLLFPPPLLLLLFPPPPLLLLLPVMMPPLPEPASSVPEGFTTPPQAAVTAKPIETKKKLCSSFMKNLRRPDIAAGTRNGNHTEGVLPSRVS